MPEQQSSILSSSKIIEARVIGTSVDGRLTEALLLTSTNDLVLAYLIMLDEKEQQKGFRVISIVDGGYYLATQWYELNHPKGSFKKLYKPSWER